MENIHANGSLPVYNSKLLVELQQAIKVEIARASTFGRLVQSITTSLEQQQKVIKVLWLKIGCLQREITKVILNKKIENCNIQPLVVTEPYSISSVLAQLVSFLRVNPSLLAKALRASTDNLKLLATFVVYGMFHLFAEHDELLLLNLIKSLMEGEFAEEDYELHLSLFNPTSIFDLVLRAYFRVGGVNDYFIVLFGDLVSGILQDRSEERFTEVQVSSYVDRFELLVKQNVSSMPFTFRWVLTQLKRCMIQKGVSAEDITSAIGKFVFYYVFERGLFKPEYTGYMLFTRPYVSQIARDNLTAITRQLRTRMESTLYTEFVDALLVGIEEPVVMFAQALRQQAYFHISYFLSKEAIAVITKPLSIMRSRSKDGNKPASKEEQTLNELMLKVEEKLPHISKLQDDIHIEFELSLRQEQEQLGLERRQDRVNVDNRDPTLGDALAILKGVLAIPSQLPAGHTVDVITTLQRYKLVNWRSSNIIATIDHALELLQKLPTKFKDNDYDLLLKELRKKTEADADNVTQVHQLDFFMATLDSVNKHCSTLKEVHNQLLEFFTSFKLLKFESVRLVIDNGVEVFKFQPLSQACSCIVNADRCQVCTKKSETMHIIMKDAAMAMDTSGMWSNASKEERQVALNACERSLVDRVPAEILMPILSEDADILDRMLAIKPPQDYGISPQLVHAYPYVFAQQEFLRAVAFTNPHDKLWALSKILLTIEYILANKLHKDSLTVNQ